MDLRDTLLAEHSKAQATKIINWVGNNQQRFDELFSLFLHDEYRVVQRAAWPISYCVIAHPELIRKHFTRLLSHLNKPGVHIAVKRNTMRLLQEIEIQKKYHGQVMNFCFGYIQSLDEAIAVKAFSLAVLQKMLKLYPEIGPELKLIIEDRWDYETAAFRSRARKLLKVLS